MTDPTTRELIADLLAALKSWSPTGGGPLEGAEEQYEAALIAKAEAFLAQPEPEGPTDEEIKDWHSRCADLTTLGEAEHYWAFDLRSDEVASVVSAALARWGK